MKEQEVRRIIYIADDGKEFCSKDECKEYEKYLNKINKIQYYIVYWRPDLNETGEMQFYDILAVNAHNFDNPNLIAEVYCNKTYGLYSEGVQGWGMMRAYSVNKIDRKFWRDSSLIESTKQFGKRVFISYEEVEGFPSNFYNYLNEWKVK